MIAKHTTMVLPSFHLQLNDLKSFVTVVRHAYIYILYDYWFTATAYPLVHAIRRRYEHAAAASMHNTCLNTAQGRRYGHVLYSTIATARKVGKHVHIILIYKYTVCSHCIPTCALNTPQIRTSSRSIDAQYMSEQRSRQEIRPCTLHNDYYRAQGW